MDGVAVDLELEFSGVSNFVQEYELEGLAPFVEVTHQMLHDKQGAFAGYAGWLTLPVDVADSELEHIDEIAASVRGAVDAFVVLGAGGSFLGAKALIDALRLEPAPKMLFLGHDLSSDSLATTLAYLQEKDWALNVISKSGFTLETTLAFRFLKQQLELKYGQAQAAKRIYVTTDPASGCLRKFADDLGCVSFAIPSDVGGRYSLFTPVGLFPLAVAGISLVELLRGAKLGFDAVSDPSLNNNLAYKYAATRNLLYRQGKAIEIFINFDPAIASFGGWWQQLFGESEGKQNSGIFPAMANCTADLHSMGQYMQEGLRHLFETVLFFKRSRQTLLIPEDAANFDGLNYLTGRSMDEINLALCEGMIKAHIDGGVPVLKLLCKEKSACTFGYLSYFFMKACAMSSCLGGVNPFDQPGVDVYKQNAFATLRDLT